MAGMVWTLAHLTEEQERLLKEAEATLGDNVLLAYSPQEVSPGDLTESQQERIKTLEDKLGVTILAVRPS